MLQKDRLSISDNFFLFVIGPIYIGIATVIIALLIGGSNVKPKSLFFWENSGTGLTELYNTTAVLKGKTYLICEHFAEYHTFCFKSKSPYTAHSEVYFLLHKEN